MTQLHSRWIHSKNGNTTILRKSMYGLGSDVKFLLLPKPLDHSTVCYGISPLHRTICQFDVTGQISESNLLLSIMNSAIHVGNRDSFLEIESTHFHCYSIHVGNRSGRKYSIWVRRSKTLNSSPQFHSISPVKHPNQFRIQ